MTRARKLILIIGTAITLGLTAISGMGQTKRKPVYTVPVNTIIHVRMNENLTSKNAKIGDKFTTTVVTPIYAKGKEVIPAGSIIGGSVTQVTRAGRKSQAGALEVAFHSVEIPNGTRHQLKGALISAEEEGGVKGKSSRKRNAAFVGRGAVVGGLINGAAGAATGAVIGVARGLIKKGQEAEVPSGTQFDIILDGNISLPAFR